MTLGDSPEARQPMRPRLRRGRRMFPLPGPFRAAMFDLDGLLIDSEPLWGRAEAAVVEARGGRLTPADRLATIGRSIDASLALYAARLGLPETAVGELRADLIGRMRGLIAREGRAQPGAAAVVERLAGHMPLALASNTDRRLVALALDRIGLSGRFAAVVTAAEVGAAKPAPDVYLAACAGLGVDPADAVGFEDSPSGIAALRAAGIASVGVRAGGPFDLAAADIVVDSLEDVVDWFDEP